MSQTRRDPEGEPTVAISGLTIRLDSVGGLVSRDDGATTEIGDQEIRAFSRMIPERPLWTYGGLTAAAAGILGEAVAINPHSDLWQQPMESLPEVVAISDQPDTPVARLLRRRTSERRMGSCSKQQILKLLNAVNGVLAQERGPDGFPISHRGIPSAGARHPIDLVVACNRVGGLSRGYYAFDPYRRRLEPSAVHRPLDQTLERVSAVGNLEEGAAAVIFLICDLERTLSRYPSGVTLAILDAGVLSFALHLLACELDMASVIVGTSGLLQRASRSKPRQDLACVAIGSKLRDSSRTL